MFRLFAVTQLCCHVRRDLWRSVTLFAWFVVSVFLAAGHLNAATGFNLMGDGPTNTRFARGPGLAAFETIPAPQGNPNLYQRRVVVVGFQALHGGPLRSVSGAFFGSQNVQNQLVPVDLRQVPGKVICSLWINGLAGFSARPGQPDVEFEAGSTANLLPSGSITNSATGTVYPLYLARVDLGGAVLPGTAISLESGSEYAIGLRVRYACVTAVTARLAVTVLTEDPSGNAVLRGGSYTGPDIGNTTLSVALPALAVEYGVTSPPRVHVELLGLDRVRLSLVGELSPYRFLRFEAATQLSAPVEWFSVPGLGDPPLATIELSGTVQGVYRAVFQE